jgi:hypothetical protein
MNYNQRLFLNWVSAAWFGLSVVGSVLYCNGFRADEKELVLARLTCGVVIAWGLLVICIIRSVVRAEKIRFWDFIQRFHEDIPYMTHLALWVLFALLMFMYRFEKVWVIPAVCRIFFLERDAAGKGEVSPQFLQRHPAQLCAGDGLLPAPQTAPLLDALPVWRHVPYRGVHGDVPRGGVWGGSRKAVRQTQNAHEHGKNLLQGIFYDGVRDRLYTAHNVEDGISYDHRDSAFGSGADRGYIPKEGKADCAGAGCAGCGVSWQLSDGIYGSADGSGCHKRPGAL